MSKFFPIQILSFVLGSDQNVDCGPSRVDKIVPGPSSSMVSSNRPSAKGAGDPYLI
jgi:hypothetical protein